MGEFPSGQRGQTVNLLRFASMVRIRPPPPINPRTVTVLGFFAAFIGIVGTFVLSQSVLVANPLRLCYTGRV